MKQILLLILFTTLLITGCSSDSNLERESKSETLYFEETTAKEKATASLKIDTTTVSESTSYPDTKEMIVAAVDLSIRNSVEKLNTTIRDISINENLGTDDLVVALPRISDNGEDYIALIYLSFDAKNRPSTAKEMITLINNEVAYNLVTVNDITEITIFWTVPYLDSSGNSIAKANLLRNDKGFYFVEEWYNTDIFTE